MRQTIGKPNWPWLRYKLRTYVCFVLGHPYEELGFKVDGARLRRCLRCGELDPSGRQYFWNPRWGKR